MTNNTLMKMMIGVMNVTLWECLPIAILMQILATCLHDRGSKTSSTPKISIHSEERFAQVGPGQESAVGKMLWHWPTLIILQQACLALLSPHIIAKNLFTSPFY